MAKSTISFILLGLCFLAFNYCQTEKVTFLEPKLDIQNHLDKIIWKEFSTPYGTVRLPDWPIHSEFLNLMQGHVMTRFAENGKFYFCLVRWQKIIHTENSPKTDYPLSFQNGHLDWERLEVFKEIDTAGLQWIAVPAQTPSYSVPAEISGITYQSEKFANLQLGTSFQIYLKDAQLLVYFSLYTGFNQIALDWKAILAPLLEWKMDKWIQYPVAYPHIENWILTNQKGLSMDFLVADQEKPTFVQVNGPEIPIESRPRSNELVDSVRYRMLSGTNGAGTVHPNSFETHVLENSKNHLVYVMGKALLRTENMNINSLKEVQYFSWYCKEEKVQPSIFAIALSSEGILSEALAEIRNQWINCNLNLNKT